MISNEVASLNLPYGIDQNITATSDTKASEVYPLQSLLAIAEPHTSTLVQPGSVTPEPSRPLSLVPNSPPEQDPFSVVASRLPTQHGGIRRALGESCTGGPILGDEDLRPGVSSAKPAKDVKQVRCKIDSQVISDLAQHKHQPACTLFDQTRREPFSPDTNRSLENGLSLASPVSSIHSALMISTHNLSSPISFHTPSVKLDPPSTSQKQESLDSSYTSGITKLLAPNQLCNMNVKRSMKEVETLRADVKELQYKRDEARRRCEEEQNKTERLAVSRETQFSYNDETSHSMIESSWSGVGGTLGFKGRSGASDRRMQQCHHCPAGRYFSFAFPFVRLQQWNGMTLIYHARGSRRSWRPWANETQRVHWNRSRGDKESVSWTLTRLQAPMWKSILFLSNLIFCTHFQGKKKFLPGRPG